MEHKESLAMLRKYFKASGHLYSVERERMLEVIDTMDGQFTLIDLYKKCKEKGSIQSPSTLYRCIYVFVNAGIITRIKLCKGSKGNNVYEKNVASNDYLLCVGCNSMKHIELSSSALHAIQKKICKENGFEMLTYVNQIRGYCADCQKKING